MFINFIEIVIWVVIGGRGILYGVIIGVIVVSFVKIRLIGIMFEVWLFVFGGLFVLVILLLFKGLVGLIDYCFFVKCKVNK